MGSDKGNITVKLAINQATTMPARFEQDLPAYAAAGFTAVELWLEKVEDFLEGGSLDDARKLLEDNGLVPIGACYQPDLMLSQGAKRTQVLAELESKLEICQALDVPTLVVPTDFPEEPVTPDHYTRSVAGLREAAEIAEPYQVQLGIEFVAGAALIGTLSTTLDIARKTAKDNVGIVLDTFHLYTGISKLADIHDIRPQELLLVHLNDLQPGYVELATDSARVLPGDGIMPLKGIILSIIAIGYQGYYSVELFSQYLWNQSPQQAALTAFESTSHLFEAMADGS